MGNIKKSILDQGIVAYVTGCLFSEKKAGQHVCCHNVYKQPTSSLLSSENLHPARFSQKHTGAHMDSL